MKKCLLVLGLLLITSKICALTPYTIEYDTTTTPTSMIQRMAGEFRIGNSTVTYTVLFSSYSCTFDNTVTFSVQGTGSFNNLTATGTITLPSASLDGADIKNDEVTDTQLQYNTGQHLTSVSTPTFAQIDTGQGATEVYEMNQNVTTTSTPTFSGASISSLTITEAFTFPLSDGISNQYMKTDGDGTISWASLTGMLSNGTTTNNCIYWDGASWSETDSLQNAGSGGVTTINRVLISSSIGDATPVANTIYQESLIKGWIQMDQIAGTITNSFNVSSITDHGAGDFSIIWDTNFANAAYACVATSQTKDFATIISMGVGDVRVKSIKDDGSATDRAIFCVIAIGDQ